MFTDRQQQVIDCLFQAMCNKEIAQELGCANRTVKTHIRNIAMKLGIWGDKRFIMRVRIVYLLQHRAETIQ